VLLGTGNGAGTEQVASVKVTAGDGVVSNSLSDGEVKIFSVRDGKLVEIVHLGGLDLYFKVDIVAAHIGVLKVLHNFGVLLFGKSNLEGFESLGSDNPWGDGAAEVLGIEGSKRHILPNLQITS
jgi:hypothetical protein